MKFDRDEIILHMINELWMGKGISVPEVIKKFPDIADRTVRKYLKEYIKPLFFEQIVCSGNRWITTTDLKTLTNLRPQELTALIQLDESINKITSRTVRKSAQKMVNKFRKGEFRNELVKNINIESLDGFHDYFNLTLNAIRGKRTIKCSYNRKERDLEPLQLLLIEGYWYLYAIDVKSIGERKAKNFHFKSIQGIEIQDNNFKSAISDYKNFKNAINAFYSPQNEPIHIELAVHKNIIKYFHRVPLSPTQKIVRAIDDTWYQVELVVTDLNEIVPTIKKYLPDIVALKPDELADRIKDDLENYLKLLTIA